MEEDPDTPTAVTSSESVSPAPHSTFTKIQVLFSSRRKITLEPILFLFNVASYVVWVTAQDLMVRKSCLVNYGYPESSCDDLNSNESLQTEVHSMVSDFLMWKSILEASLKVVAVPILAWWSDRVGTKWPLVFCLSCLALESSFLLLNTLMTSWPLEFVLISAIFYGFSGGVHGLLMLAFSLMAKTTSTGSRTLRMGILDGFYYLGSPIGLLLAPLIFQSAGYVGIFTGAVGVYGLAIAYVFLRITHEEGARLTQVSNTDTAQEEEDGTFLCGLDRFAISFWSTFKKRRNADRSHILVCVLAMLLDSFVIWGEANVKYLFVQKAFDWSYSKYSLFSSLSSLITVVGALLIVPLITIKTSFSDSVIGLTGAVSRVVERVFYSLASCTPTLSWLMYVGCLAGVGSPLVPIAIRSLISKIAEEDTAQIYSVMAVGETLLPFGSSPSYSMLYKATQNSFPGAFYVLSASLNTFVSLCFTYLIVFRRMRRQNDEGRMHSFLSRVNSVVAFACTTLAALTFLCFCSTFFNQYNADVKIEAVNVFLKNAPDYMVSQTKNDLGIMKLDISADLRPLFNWNSRQLFIYLTAEYESKVNKLNQVVLWDKIILRGENANLNLKSEPLKYYFWDDGNGLLGNNNVTLYMSWNVVPTAGHLPTWVGTGKQVVKFPTKYA